MRKEYLVLLAAGCVFANAANVNYDLLGRKGSKMNSPMVYKNVDYSKNKKNELQKNSPLENRSLAKVGLGSYVLGIEGIYNSRSTSNNKFGFKSFSNSEQKGCTSNEICYDWNEYKKKVNASVLGKLKIIEHQVRKPSSEVDFPHAEAYVGKPFYWAHTDPYADAGATFEDGNSCTGYTNFEKRDHSRYSYYHSETHSSGSDSWPAFNTIKNTYSQGSGISSSAWNTYDNTSSEVGVFMSIDALPVHLGWANKGKFADYVRYDEGGDVYENADPQKEIRESRTLGLIKAGATHGSNNMNRSVVFIGKTNVRNTTPDGINCTANNCLPQVYIGVRNNNNGNHYTRYNTDAQSLDDYIYENRTIEFVPSGDYSSGQMFARGFAANAITVGSLELVTEGSKKLSKVASYASTVSNDEYNTNPNPYYHGTNKPEVFNYTHFKDVNDLAKSYYDHNITQTMPNATWGDLYLMFSPLYDYSETSAAYTAGMVSNLLATNPFYRWHPEVVKAILLTSNGTKIDPPYVDYQVTTKVPSYKYLAFNDQKASNLGIYSRYWNGNIQKFQANGHQNEIFFVIDNTSHKREAFSAAISWLNKGSDITANGGTVPQDFDMYVYGKNSLPSIDSKGTQIGSSESAYNSFEKVDVSASKANYNYLAIHIKLVNDKSSSENKGQILLGFNLASSK